MDRYIIILGLNPLGQSICRYLYDGASFETVLIFNSSSFSTWNRFPSGMKPPVIPVHAMISGELMIVFGDVFIKDFEFVTDMLFYLKRTVPSEFIIGFSKHEDLTCGQVLTRKAEELLKQLDIPKGRGDYYDGVTGPLLSLGNATEINPIILFLEDQQGDTILQIGDVAISQEDIDMALELLQSLVELER